MLFCRPKCSYLGKGLSLLVDDFQFACLFIHLASQVIREVGVGFYGKKRLYSTGLTYLPWRKGEVFCEKPFMEGA